MKITFDSTFAENARRIEAYSQPSEAKSGAEQFGKLLREISPDAIQPTAINTKNIETPIVSVEDSDQDGGPFARFDFSKPSLAPPSIERVAENMPPSSMVNETPPNVKKPTLVEAKRIFPNEDQNTAHIENIKGIVDAAAKKHKVDPALGMAVASVESGFNPSAVSSDGHMSKGLFQLLDTTGQDMYKKLGLSGRYDPFNPKMNTDLGFHYLRYLHDIFSTNTKLPNNTSTQPAANSSSLEKLALAAYNAGEGRVASAQHHAVRHGYNPGRYEEIEPYLPKTTREYVESVLGRKPGYTKYFGQQEG